LRLFTWAYDGYFLLAWDVIGQPAVDENFFVVQGMLSQLGKRRL
jgi:hypothetical protein